MKDKSKSKKSESEIVEEFDTDFLDQILNNKQGTNDKPISSYSANELAEDSEHSIPHTVEATQEAKQADATVSEVSATNNITVDGSASSSDEEQTILDKKLIYSKLSLEDKFKKARRTKWFKIIKRKVAMIYFFPVHKKDRIRQQKQIFVRRFNEYFGTNFRIDTLDNKFNWNWQRYVDSKAFATGVRIWIGIVGVIVLPIALYFIITSGQHVPAYSK
ncbi:hypothetical protein [Ureaplasma ceti]|uniref:Uncharacterized protein n=1 Tax=Ureaplasma ceti TaxID=3119530 RepID=A0ABP9UA66_9BACT